MKRRVLLIGLLLLVVVVLVPLLQDVVRDGLVTPLLYVAWFGRLLFDSVPQQAGWLFLVGIATLLAWRSLVPRSAPTLVSREREAAPRGRVTPWVRLLRGAESDPYGNWRLQHRLAQLSQEVLALQERVPQREIRQRLVRNTLDLPPEVRAALRVGIESYRPPQRRRLHNRRIAENAGAAQIVAFLEERLHKEGGEDS